MSTSTPDRGAGSRKPARGAWYAPHLATASLGTYVATIALLTLPLLGGSILELGFVKSTFDLVLNQAELFSWTASVAICLLSVTTMFMSGHKYRAAVESPGLRAVSILAFASWLLLGVFLILLRLDGGQFAGAPILVSGVPLGSDEDIVGREQSLALILAVLYLACGLLAWAEGYALVNLSGIGLVWVRWRLSRLHPKLAAKYGLVNRLTEALQAARGMFSLLSHQREATEIQLGAMADSLKADARHRIAWHLGDPRSSNITDVRSFATPRTTSPLREAVTRGEWA